MLLVKNYVVKVNFKLGLNLSIIVIYVSIQYNPVFHISSGLQFLILANNMRVNQMKVRRYELHKTLI